MFTTSFLFISILPTVLLPLFLLLLGKLLTFPISSVCYIFSHLSCPFKNCHSYPEVKCAVLQWFLHVYTLNNHIDENIHTLKCFPTKQCAPYIVQECPDIWLSWCPTVSTYDTYEFSPASYIWHYVPQIWHYNVWAQVCHQNSCTRRTLPQYTHLLSPSP